VHREQREVNPIQDLRTTMEDLPVTSTGVQLTAEEFQDVDAEEQVISEMTTKEIVRLMRNDWLEPTVKAKMMTQELVRR
jgi:hypothetical protein